MTKPVETHPYFKSLVALVLIAGCLWASQWQFHRGEDRKARNDVIELRISQSESALDLVTGDVNANEWRTVTTSGEFDPTNQILLRNRYFEGKYGYGVLTRFTSDQ